MTGATLHEERPVDAAAIDALLEAAFGGRAEPELVAALRRDGALVLSLVAEDQDGRVIGHLALSRMRAPERALGLAPLAVAEAARRQGIGAALVREALARAEAGGWPLVFVLGDPAYYRRFGFDPALAARFASPYAGPHFMALSRGGGAATGGPAAYAAAFDDL